jgi:hypothetical protein
MQNVPGRRSKQRKVDRIPAVDTKDDQIGLVGRRDAEELSGRLPVSHNHARVEPRSSPERHQIFEPLPRILFERAMEFGNVVVGCQYGSLAADMLERMHEHEAPDGILRQPLGERQSALRIAGEIDRAQDRLEWDYRSVRRFGCMGRYGEGGTGCMPKDVLGNGSEQPAFEPARPVSAHDDQIGPELTRGSQDFLGDVSLANAHPGERSTRGAVNERPQLGLFDLRVHGKQWRGNRVLRPEDRRYGQRSHGEDRELRSIRLLEREGVLKCADGEIGLVDRTKDSFEASHDETSLLTAAASVQARTAKPSLKQVF